MRSGEETLFKNSHSFQNFHTGKNNSASYAGYDSFIQARYTLLGTLRCHDGDDNENVKQTMG